MSGVMHSLAAVCWLLTAGAHSSMFDELFGTSASICTDATPLASKCDCLRGIDCAGRGLGDLPVGLTLPYSFSDVTFGGNKLTVVKRGQFQWNPVVTTLRLSHNLVAVVEPQALAGLSSLHKLLLDHNQLTELNLEALQGVYELAQLDLSFNRLRVLDPLLFVNTDIHELRLRHNPLVRLDPRLLLFVPRLRLLDLGSADLTALPADLLVSSRLLETLLLPDNQLLAVPSETLAAAPGLRTLDLSGNRLESVPSAGLTAAPSLRRLDLSWMRSLRRLEAHAFSGLDQLEELRCGSGGALAEVHPDAFRDAISEEHLARLVRVDLTENNLTGISRDLLPWERMELVGVVRNPLTCDCDMAWVADGAFPFEKESLVVCEKPKAAAGQLVSSLKAAEFGCQDGFVADTGLVAAIGIAASVALVVTALLLLVERKLHIFLKARAKLLPDIKRKTVMADRERAKGVDMLVDSLAHPVLMQTASATHQCPRDYGRDSHRRNGDGSQEGSA